MNFFLGTHQTQWLGRVTVPLFISRRRLCERKSLPSATCDWALDSGGFSELSLFGTWTVGSDEYIAEVRRYRDEIGRMQWASCQDWMCEPWMLERTGMTVSDHQRLTTRNYLELRQKAPDVTWLPVLQGWQEDDYLRHWEQYEREGVDLAGLSVVGLGSVCRRQHMEEARQIVERLQPLQLHGFGFKLTGLSMVGDVLASSDSMAWSLHARHRPPLPGCPHKSCANCVKWALKWRQQVLGCLRKTMPRQLTLDLT